MNGRDKKGFPISWVNTSGPSAETTRLYQSFNAGAHHFNGDIYKNFSFMVHLHRDLEFVLVLDGKIEVIVEGRTETARRGDLALFLSHQKHGLHTPAYSQTLVVTFSEQFVKSFVQEMKGRSGEHSVFHASKGLLAYLNECYFTAVPPNEMALKASLYAICSRYLSVVPLVNSPVKHNTLLSELLAYIEQHYRDHITLETMSDAVGYDANYISRYFNQIVGISLPRFINQYRIDDAISLLNEGGRSITEIAMEVGFQSVRSFNREFKTITGKTPSQFLRE